MARPEERRHKPSKWIKRQCQLRLYILISAFLFLSCIASHKEAALVRAKGAVGIPRRLSKHHHHKKRDEPLDYTEYSCDALPNLRAKYPDKFDQCEFAKICNGGDGIIFPSLFCDNKDGYDQHHYLLILFLSLSLLLLFRLLGSTTDEFFSPGLELFSLKLGLPPRFAGVTLLALGNGAPDVAATMNAILGDEKHGYEMALGELTGTAMFVTSVILGVIVSLSGSNKSECVSDEKEEDKVKQKTCQQDQGGGVPCKGPLLRDIVTLILICGVSMAYLKDGVVGYGFVYTLLGLYGAYVLLVGSADAYMHFYHAPSLMRNTESGVSLNSLDDSDGEEESQEKAKDSRKDEENGRRAIFASTEQSPLVSSNTSSYLRCDSAPQQRHDQQQKIHHLYHHNSLPVHSHSLGGTFIEAISNYSCAVSANDQAVTSSTISTNTNSAQQVASPNIDLPKASASPEGVLKKKASEGWPVTDDGEEPLVVFHPHHAVHPHHGPGGLLFLRSKSTGYQPTWSQEKNKNTAGQLRQSSSCDASASGASMSPLAVKQPHATAAMQIASSKDATTDQSDDEDINDAIDNIPRSWKEAWLVNALELKVHWHDFFTDIYHNEDNSLLDVIFLSVELPFTIARKLTNPVPCDGYYCRPLVAISLALSPIWLWFYFSDQFDVDIFASYIGYAISTTTVTSALVVLRWAPGGDGPMGVVSVVPLTLYGFAIAATWLDSIADKLVDLLALFGILLRIPSTVLGLTVLAFGNSLQDLVANVTLSNKGLSTMATTACFAGPIFNLCIGLGFGFWALMQSTGKDSIRVDLPTNIETGFWFTIANCALVILSGVVVGKGTIGRGYGYLACGLYLVYVVTSLNFG